MQHDNYSSQKRTGFRVSKHSSIMYIRKMSAITYDSFCVSTCNWIDGYICFVSQRIFNFPFCIYMRRHHGIKAFFHQKPYHHNWPMPSAAWHPVMRLCENQSMKTWPYKKWNIRHLLLQHFDNGFLNNCIWTTLITSFYCTWYTSEVYM